MTIQKPRKEILPSPHPVGTAWSPLQRELNRFVEELAGFGSWDDTRFAPRMDIVETATGLDITVEAPGLSADQIKVTADGDLLTISGEKATSNERTEGAMRLSERHFGQFSRSITLPRSADSGRISAAMRDGVLKIEIPKRADAATKTIEIQSK